MKKFVKLLFVLSVLFTAFSCSKSDVLEYNKQEEHDYNNLSIINDLEKSKKTADYGWIEYEENAYIVNNSDKDFISVSHFEGVSLSKLSVYPEIKYSIEEISDSEIKVSSSFLKEELIIRNVKYQDNEILMDIVYQNKTIEGLAFHSHFVNNYPLTTYCGVGCIVRIVSIIVTVSDIISDAMTSECKHAMNICRDAGGVPHVLWSWTGACKEVWCEWPPQS